MISVYSKKTEIELSQRKIEVIEKYNKIIQYGRINPVWFIENVFKVELLDYQKWVIMNSWTTEKAIWVCSRNTGKTFMGSLYIMAKNLLFPSFETWLMSLTAGQAQGLFKKMEDIAKHNIASLVGSSDVFKNEVIKSQANTDGFLHGQTSYKCELYNGSAITSLVGKPETIVGKRSNLNAYD